MEQNLNLPYDDIDRYGDLMEICTHCSRFERRYDFDTFSMADYQSCENCRHLGHDDRCMVK
ncbi:hypothetical protein AALA24_12400 [Anaerovoracaceae bacterium 42-11]|nr:hypothetical protein [Emergencia sp.]